MSKRRTGFLFHAQTHDLPTNHIGSSKPNIEPIKQPNSYEHSTINGGGQRFGFPSSMFQRGDKNNALFEPTVIADGGWVRPSPTGWTLPPDEPLDPTVKNSSTSTANIGRSPAVNVGGEKKLDWGSRPIFAAVKKATRLETIDSSEAAKKYGGKFMF